MSYLAKLKEALAGELRPLRAPTLTTQGSYVGNVGTSSGHISPDMERGLSLRAPQKAPDTGTDVTAGRATATGHDDDGSRHDALSDAVVDAIEERLAIVTCPAPYRRAFARLNYCKPVAVSVDAWECAVNDAGLFFDSWGTIAAQLGWTAGDLLDVRDRARRGGLIWQLRGVRVAALGADHARLDDERLFDLRG